MRLRECPCSLILVFKESEDNIIEVLQSASQIKEFEQAIPNDKEQCLDETEKNVEDVLLSANKVSAYFFPIFFSFPFHRL